MPKFSIDNRTFSSRPVVFSCPKAILLEPKAAPTPAPLDPVVPIPAPTKVPGFFRFFPNHKIASVVSGFAIGTLAGFAGSLVGLGGAFIMIPLFASILLFSQHQATGTSLCAVAVTGAIGAYNYWTRGRLSLVYGALIAITASLMARVGALTAAKLDGKAMKKGLGIWWMIASVRIAYTAAMMFQGAVAVSKAASPLASASLSNFVPLAIQNWGTAAIMLATGTLSGFVAGLLGVAGGTIVVPVLTEMGVVQQAAQGTALFSCVVPALVGSFTHLQKHNVRLEVLPGVLPGVILGATLGSKIACFLPERTMKVIFAAILLYSGAKMAGFICRPKSQADAPKQITA